MLKGLPDEQLDSQPSQADAVPSEDECLQNLLLFLENEWKKDGRFNPFTSLEGLGEALAGATWEDVKKVLLANDRELLKEENAYINRMRRGYKALAEEIASEVVRLGRTGADMSNYGDRQYQKLDEDGVVRWYRG